MNARLRLIQNWPEQARSAEYCVHALAQQCGVSTRTLQRHFARETGALPRDWLHAERMKEAGKLLRSGWLVKQTAAHLGYKNQHHFSRDFRKHYGHPPSQHQRRVLLQAKSGQHSTMTKQSRK